MNPTREILFNVGAGGVLALYLLMTIPFLVLAYGLARRVVGWRRGQPEQRFDQLGRRILYALRMSVMHGRIVRKKNLYGGIMHACIFAGIVILLIGTFLVMVEADIAVPMLGRGFLHGGFYLGFKLAMNLAGLLVIAGVGMAFYRRLFIRPRTLQTTGDDLLLLSLLLLLVVQGFVLQALRIAMTQDPWGAWSFVSYPMSLSFARLDSPSLALIHQFNWYAHFATAFAFIGYAAYSKLIHVFTALANVTFRRLKPRGELDGIPNFETAETVGASKLEHFTWAQRMSLDACMHCGRCLEFCPTFNTGKPLRPRDLVLELTGLQADQGGIFSGVLGEDGNAGRSRWGKGADRELIGSAVSQEEIWDCTTCGSCMEQCPVHIEHVPLIISLRRNLVMERNEFPSELESIFTSMERLGNPYQYVPQERAAWTAKLAQPVAEMAQVAESGKTVDYLFFVGCMGSFVGRNQKTTIALTQILQAAGLSFAILGKEESCTGDPARRMGHEFLAQQLASQLVDKFNRYEVKKVVTACPHCFNAIKNEYPQLGGNYEVIHHTELIAELIASGRIGLKETSEAASGRVTYHDPCYLGRYNGVIDEPRGVLKAVLAEEVVEMPRNRRQSFCCGGGGGRAMMKEDRGTRINVERVKEAIKTGASTIAAGCPFCMSMLEDGIGAQEAAGSVRVLDVAELVAGSLADAKPIGSSPPS